MNDPGPSGETIDWLLDSDPALRWQVERDLLGEPEAVWRATRMRTVTEGMGARLLALQDADGQWAGGAYFPKNQDPYVDGTIAQGQPWTATTWSLNTLREWGVPARALAGTAEKIAANSRWEYDDLPYWGGEVDACINGFTLANGGWLGANVGPIADWFVDHQMSEGGWNCEWVEGSARASVHSTINAVSGILSYEQSGDASNALRAARLRAQEYLLGRELMFRSDGELISENITRFGYPFRWPLTALRGLDYFRSASLHDGVTPDSRLARAAQVVRSGADEHSRWIQGVRYPGQVWFELDVPVGEPSRWLTFYAIRALRWWDGE